jgi:subtilase family serine protease
MITHKVLSVLAAVVLNVSLVPAGAGAVKTGSVASPFLKVGPQAIPVSSAGPNFGLFSCQLVGLSPGATCYDPFQMRHAYNIDTLIKAGLDGRGRTIVIVDAFQSPHIVAELNFFNNFYGLPGLNLPMGPASIGTFTQVAPDGLTPFNPANGDMVGWAEEISLDVEWAHAIAPNANIVLVLAKSDADTDLLSATKYAVDHRLGDIISQSFGENESCVDPALLAKEHQVFADATMKNITIFASSGDNGAAQSSCDGSTIVRAVSFPANDPLVTAVGGTELHAARYCLTSLGCVPAANPAPGTYQGEIAWNEAGIGATGGGFSVLYDAPSFQKGTIRDGNKQRGMPDVSYDAAVLHGVLTYLDIPGLGTGFFLFGGTSAGSPQWAAILAIANQQAGYNLGFINSALYRIGKTQQEDGGKSGTSGGDGGDGGNKAPSFFDITSGNNSVVEDVAVKGFTAGPGWDATTGLGSPTTDQLVKSLIQFVSPGDGSSVIAETKPHTDGNPSESGRMKTH